MTPQEIFDSTYITSREISTRLKVNRSSISHAIRRGFLPLPIRIADANISLWQRAEVEPRLTAWSYALNSRRGELV